MAFRAITISGEVCSGKSSIANALISLLPGWKLVNIGQRFRYFCSSKGMSIQLVSTIDDETHMAFDKVQKDLLERERNIVAEGRLAGWLAHDLEDVFRVFCFAPLEVRIQRYIIRDETNEAQAKIDIVFRDSKDLEKFKHIYSLDDYRDQQHYHLILDTSSLKPEELAGMIVNQAGLAVY